MGVCGVRLLRYSYAERAGGGGGCREVAEENVHVPQKVFTGADMLQSNTKL